MTGSLADLLPGLELETVPVLRQAASAHRYLAELKGVSRTIPNQGILINTLALREAKDSSAIENIITSHDELFKEELFPEQATNPAAREVRNYATALKIGFELIRGQRLLTCNHIVAIQAELEKNRAGFRKLPGTVLKNEQTGQTVFTPPQHPEEIVKLMADLERFINDDSVSAVDPLVKMAIIHHQFESIHPFYYGNGRTGRIINVLYLVLEGLLDIPVLYLSRYLVQNKAIYYRELQAVRETRLWEPWLLYMLRGVEETARQTIQMVEETTLAIESYKERIRAAHKFYSQDLIDHLFYHPYTRIEFLQRALDVSRLTATKYLDTLCKDGLLQKEKIGRASYYINTALFGILTQEHNE
ncbi:MAG: Fic family protein [Spirochaetales bacterium]|nr:Fic family protein [Spirochaetales bacterium]